MKIKYFSAVIALVLLFAFLLPIAWKLKDVALSGVIIIGVVLALVDLRQSLRGKDT